MASAPSPSLASHFRIRSRVESAPPWELFDGIEVLSEREVFLARPDPMAVELRTVELRYRHSLFASSGVAWIKSADAIEENGGSPTVIIDAHRETLLSHLAPTLTVDEAHAVAEQLLLAIADIHAAGLFCWCLDPASIGYANGKVEILPTAFLLPHSRVCQWARKSEAPVAPELTPGGCPHPGSDLFALGKVIEFLFGSRGDGAETPAPWASIMEGFREILPRNRPTLKTVLGDLGLERRTSDLASRRCFFPFSDMEEPPLLDRFLQGVKDGEPGGLCILRGGPGSGKTRLLMTARCALSEIAEIESWGPDHRLEGSRPNESAAEKTPDRRPAVLLVDDFHIKARSFPFLLELISDPNLFEGRHVLMTVDPDRSPSEFEETLGDLSKTLGDRYQDVNVPGIEEDGWGRYLVYDVDKGSSPTRIAESVTPTTPLHTYLREVLDRPGSAPRDGEAGLRSRLEALPDEERHLLTFLGVFADDVDLENLIAVHRSEEELFRRLGSLQRKGLVCETIRAGRRRLSKKRRETSRAAPETGGESRLLFGGSFASVAEELVETLSSERRTALHDTIAQILAGNEDAPLLRFYHLVAARKKKTAAEFGLSILEKRGARGADATAAHILDTFLREEMLEHVDRGVWLRVYRDLGDHFFKRGHLDRAEQTYREGLQRLGALKDSIAGTEIVPLMAQLASVLEKQGRYEEAREILRHALEDFGEALNIEERAHLYYLSAWISYRLGELDQAFEQCNLVLRSVDPKRAPLRVADAYNLLGNIYLHRSRWTDAVSYFEKCIDLRRKAGDEIKIAAALNNLGLTYRSMGETDMALRYLEESQAIKQRLGDAPGVAAGTYNFALVYLDRGELERARAYCLRAIELNHDLGNRQLLAECYRALGDIALAERNLQDAEKFYRMDLEICQDIGATNERAVVLSKLARLDMKKGNLEGARAMAEEAESLAEHIGSVLEKTNCTLVKGEILLKEGDRSLAKEHFERAAYQYISLGKNRSAADTFARIGLLYIEENLPTRAREYLEKALSYPSATPAEGLTELEERLKSVAPELVGEIVSDSQRLLALCQLSSLANADLEPPDMEEQVLEMALRFTRGDRALLVRRADGGTSFVLAAAIWPQGTEPQLTKKIVRVLKKTVEEARPLTHAHGRSEGEPVHALESDRPGFLSLPLTIAGRIDAGIYLESDTQTFDLSPMGSSFWTAFCQLAATGLEKAGLRAHMRRQGTGPAIAESTQAILTEEQPFPNMIGKSPSMQHVFKRIAFVRDMDATILLLGGSGTGKEETAKSIHYSSKRHEKPFVAINCAAIPETLLESELFGHEKGAFTDAHSTRRGHFETAQEGTIFLDEIGDMPFAMQAKLLRILQEKEFVRLGGSRTIKTNARVITSTNKDLLNEVHQGRFREDLYYRLNVFPIKLPPLRERKEDIPSLVSYFLKKHCQEFGVGLKRVSPEAMNYIMAYDWPGNVRELENVLRQCIILTQRETLLPEDFPEEILHPRGGELEGSTLTGLLQEIVRSCTFSPEDPLLPKVEALLAQKMVEHVGEKTRAATLLGISKPTLYAKLKRIK